MMKELNKVHAVLSNDIERTKYDAWLTGKGHYELDQTFPVDQVREMVLSGVKYLPKGGYSRFLKNMEKEFPEAFNTETTDKLMAYVWSKTRELRANGETVIRYQGQDHTVTKEDIKSRQNTQAENAYIGENSDHKIEWLKKASVIPVIILLILVGAWFFRWDYTANQTFQHTKVIHKYDRWTGNPWFVVYYYSDNR